MADETFDQWFNTNFTANAKGKADKMQTPAPENMTCRKGVKGMYPSIFEQTGYKETRDACRKLNSALATMRDEFHDRCGGVHSELEETLKSIHTRAEHLRNAKAELIQMREQIENGKYDDDASHSKDGKKDNAMTVERTVVRGDKSTTKKHVFHFKDDGKAMDDIDAALEQLQGVDENEATMQFAPDDENGYKTITKKKKKKATGERAESDSDAEGEATGPDAVGEMALQQATYGGRGGRKIMKPARYST